MWFAAACNAFAQHKRGRYLQDMSRPYNEYTWATAHNSHADAGKVAAWARNQRTDMYDQLKHQDIRGLMIDIRYEDGRVELTHGEDNAGEFADRMNDEIVRFLNENREAVLWFDIEVTDGVLTKAQLQDAMDDLPNLTNRLFYPEHALWTDHTQWPTLSELVAADQRVIMIIDEEGLAGDYGMGTILYRPHVTAENKYAVTSLNSCEERHGYNSPSINISGRDWSRLFTMNHFGRTGDAVQAGNDNNWDGLYPRITTSTAAANIGSRPNFLAVDFVTTGDVQEIAEVMTEGGIIFYEGNHATQNIVCGIGVGQSSTVRGGEHGCENDEARSAKFVQVPPKTKLTVYDDPGGSMSDDYTTVTTKKFTSDVVISSFESDASNDQYDQSHQHNNGLDGKISRFEVVAAKDNSLNPRIVFYEGSNGSQNIVCGLSMVGAQSINFKNHGDCDNDETRSVRLLEMPAGVEISVFDSPGGSTGDDFTVITVLKDIVTHYTVRSYESSYTDEYVSVSHRHHNGLDGKVSRMEVKVYNNLLMSALGGRKCLDMNNKVGIHTHLWDCSLNNNNQGWKMDANGYIFASAVGEFKLCLDPRGPSTASGTVIHTWNCISNYSYQQWILNPDDTISPKNDPTKCITVTDGSGYNGSGVSLQTCNGFPGQKWFFYHQLRNNIGNKYLDTGGGAHNGQNTHLWDCHMDSNNQAWAIDREGYIHSFIDPGKCLDAGQAGELYGTVFLWDCHGGEWQRWTRYTSGRFKNKAFEKYLGVADCGTNPDDMRLELRNHEHSGPCGDAQQWERLNPW